jgi:RimJ/RimL family protein N-acetyltransferase
VSISEDARDAAFCIPAGAGGPHVKSFDLQPHLVGDLLELRPLRADDWEGVFAAAADPMIWELHPSHDRYKEGVFREYFLEALASGGALVAVDRKTRKIIGSSRYFRHGPEPSELEIGWTFLARSHWGGDYNGEMKRLMLDHAFTFVDSVIFLVGTTNLRSRKAVEKIGGVPTDRRDTRTLHGHVVEHIVYQIKKPATID